MRSLEPMDGSHLAPDQNVRGVAANANVSSESYTGAPQWSRCTILELTKDKDEAHKAWREKRKPKLTGE